MADTLLAEYNIFSSLANNLTSNNGGKILGSYSQQPNICYSGPTMYGIMMGCNEEKHHEERKIIIGPYDHTLNKSDVFELL